MKGFMKYSRYVLCGDWDNPQSYCGKCPIRWDMNGKPTHFTMKPAFIASHHTAPGTLADGYVVAVRKFYDEPESN